MDDQDIDLMVAAADEAMSHIARRAIQTGWICRDRGLTIDEALALWEETRRDVSGEEAA